MTNAGIATARILRPTGKVRHFGAILASVAVAAGLTAGGPMVAGCREADPPALIVDASVVRVSEAAPIMNRMLRSELLAMTADLDQSQRRARLQARADEVMGALVDEQLILADGQVEDRESTLLRKIANLLDVAPGYLAEARKRASQAPARK